MLSFDPSGDRASSFNLARSAPEAGLWAERWTEHLTRPRAWSEGVDLYQRQKNLLEEARSLPALDLAQQYLFVLDLSARSPQAIFCCARHFELTLSPGDPDDPIARILSREPLFASDAAILVKTLFAAGFSWSKSAQLSMDERFETQGFASMIAIIDALSLDESLQSAPSSSAPPRL